jgi:lincosamide nucleotidyltransferase B/F
MDSENRLLTRLDAIGRALAATGDALALIGLGSVGVELDRLDAYSDLDFFVIARAGRKHRLFRDLDWISAACPIAYHFQNSEDGYKLLYEDGIFCEFAIFERAALDAIPFAEGRVVWKDASIDDRIATPRHIVPTAPARSADWLLGEALTNLYVGLGRYHRGEKLSAARFIQQYAVDRIVELTEHTEQEQPGYRDLFAPERRYEQRFPGTARRLATFMQGYDRSPESAAAMLDFLEEHFAVHPAMAQAIRALC